MSEQSNSASNPTAHRIEIKLRDINQLFNTIDASPFHDKDLDDDAEEFIVSWAREFPFQDPLVLSIHLREECSNKMPNEMIEQAVQHYFTYRAGLTRFEFRRMMEDGRISLFIGMVFLSLCLLIAGSIRDDPSTVRQVGRESLTIAGWVAMWRPLQLYLYDWWPLRNRWKVYEKLGRMKVEIIRQA